MVAQGLWSSNKLNIWWILDCSFYLEPSYRARKSVWHLNSWQYCYESRSTRMARLGVKWREQTEYLDILLFLQRFGFRILEYCLAREGGKWFSRTCLVSQLWYKSYKLLRRRYSDYISAMYVFASLLFVLNALDVCVHEGFIPILWVLGGNTLTSSQSSWRGVLSEHYDCALWLRSATDVTNWAHDKESCYCAASQYGNSAAYWNNCKRILLCFPRLE